MESKKLLKKAAISLVSANILATTVITSIPVHSWAAEEIQKTESYDNQIAKGNNLKAAQPGTINVTVVDKDGKPFAGYGIGWKDETINVGWQGKKSSSDGTAVFASSLVDPTHKYSFFVMTDANGNEINPSVHISIEPTDFKNGIANIKLPALKRVMPSDLGNQQWLIDMAEHYTGKVIGKDMSFPDLEKVTTLQSYEGFEVKDTNPVLPAGIKYFTGLQKINLRNLGLTGTIPMELGNLTNLTYLDLHDNKLEGNIPNNLNKLSKLARLDFGVNKLTGEIPSNLGELIGLTDLALGNSQLTGTIPSSLGNLTKLQALWLRNNKLVGQIPEQLFSLDAIKTAEFLDNEVTLNQTGSKEFASGITPNYMNTFVNERTLVATKFPALIKGTSVSPFRDFGLKAEINGKTSELFSGHTYQIYRVSDDELVYSGRWDENVAFEQTGASEEYRVVLDGASENPHNVGYANADGTYSKVIGQQKAGTVVGVQMFDPTIGNYSDVVSTTVEQVDPAVQVVAMTTMDTAISGTAPANAKLRIVINGQPVNIVHASANGEFTKTIGKQAEGTVVGVELFNTTTGSYESAVTIQVTVGAVMSDPAKINLISAKEGIVSGTVDKAITQVRVWKNNIAQTMVAVQEGTFTWKNTSLKAGDIVKVDYKNADGEWIESEQIVEN